MDVVFTKECVFTKSQIHELFQSVSCESVDYPDRLFLALVNSQNIYTAWNKGDLVGLISALSDGYLSAYVHYLVIRPDFRNYGIGTKLLELLATALKDIKTVSLLTHHEQAIFFKQFGFAPCSFYHPIPSENLHHDLSGKETEDTLCLELTHATK